MPAAALYPVNPADVPASMTQPGEAFKKQVAKVMMSILLFFLVYIILFILALALAAACAYGGVMLIITLPKFFTLMIGAGLIGLGAMVFFFLVKFMFAVSKTDRSRSVELKEADQPELFAFIRQITRDTQTPFPKKIFISPEPNAMVFYNSSFWSMLFPVRKNLEIGLGLVNALNLSEFKAVLAHEFGHFSQRSMKLGSFVYNVNRALYNMLFDNSGYASMVSGFANASGYFAFFANITIWIVRGIQSLLKEMYQVINKSYMGLSREMEFHADAVAASVSGSNNLITALRRVQVAADCYQTVVDKYNDWYKQNLIGHNLYPNQQTVMLRLCKDRRLELDSYQLPVISDSYLQTANYSRINYKDQWASHPNQHDREAHLRGLAIPGEVRQEPAWMLFRNAEQLQEELTAKLYNGVTIADGVTKLTPGKFEEKYTEELSNYSYPEVFKGFYDGRSITEFDVEQLTQNIQPVGFSKSAFDNIFNEENATLALRIAFVEADIRIVTAIKEKNIEVKTFDFDGEKYTRDESAQILEKLQGQLEQLKKQQQEADENAFRFFYSINADEKLKQGYAEIFANRKKDQEFYDDSNKLLQVIQPLYSGQLKEESVIGTISQLRDVDEPRLKKNLQERTAIFASNAEYSALLNKFIQSNYMYFADGSFFNNELDEMTRLIFEGSNILSEARFKQLKELLEFQASMIPQ